MCLLAEETIIVGDVIDSETGAPIENANVYYRGTTIGTTTNAEGVFMLRTDNTAKATLIVSAVGYRQQKYQIEPGSRSGMQVELKQKTTALADVFILPGENPALELMQRVREHRLENDISNSDSVTSHLGLTKQLYLSHLTARQLQRLLSDSTAALLLEDDSLAMVPVYQTTRRYLARGNHSVALDTANTVSAGAGEEDYQLLLSSLDDRQLNFYRQSVSLFAHDFISPLSSLGNSFYNYYLVDSTANPKQYIVHFVPKNSYSLCFRGEMNIDSASYALSSIKATIPRQAAVNYLTSFSVEQHFDTVHSLVNEDLSALFEITIKSDTAHRFPSVRLMRQIEGAAQTQQVSEAERAQRLARQQRNAETISELDKHIVFRLARMLAHIINTGNIPTGTVIDIGNAVELLGGSPYEGFHVGLPFTTNEKLFKHVELSAYLGYGFGDRAYKGKGQIRVKLPTERRHIIGAYYWDHYAQTDLSEMYFRLRENDVFYADQDFAHMVFGGIRRKGNYTLPATRRREFRIFTENELTDNVETQFQFGMGRMGYGDIMQQMEQFGQTSLYQNIPSFRFKTLRAEVRVGFHERKVDIFMRRIHVRSRYPAFRIMLEGGSYQTDDMERERLYGKISALVQQTVPLGICGQLDYSVMAGIIFGKVPYPMLEHFTGNQSYTYDPYRFSLMNQTQYAADRFLMAHLHWNMQGLMFNAIPYIQRLHLRELVELKFAWGAFREDHTQVVAMPATLHSMSVPYVEAGIGIGNILRVADVYAVFRLTNNKQNPDPFWAIRARFALGL